MLTKEIIHKLFDMMSHEEYTKDHTNNVLMGKVNLMLYSALGEPYFFECFPAAIPKGNHYEFKDYLIFRRPQAIKDVVQIDNYSEFQKAAKDFVGKDIDNPNMITILEMLKSDRGKLDKAHGFLDASILLTAKLARFLRRQRHMPGDIVHVDEKLEDLNMSLLDLYCEQEELQDNLDAARILANKFEISLEDPFEKVDFDHRTRWSQVSQSVVYKDIEEDENVITFLDNQSITGRIFLRDNKIDSVETYWSKSIDQTPCRVISVPWQDKIPLYNLNSIRKSKRCTAVIVCDSLTAAHRYSMESKLKIRKLQDRIAELKHQDRYKNHLQPLYDKLWQDIEPQLQKKFPEYEQNYPGNFNSSNMMSEGRNTKFSSQFEYAFFCVTTLDDIDYMSDDENFHINFNKYKNIRNLPLLLNCLFKSYNERRSKFKQNPQPTSGIFPTYIKEEFEVFTYCVSLIKEGIEKQKADDKKELQQLEQELGKLTEIVVTSWYGKDKTIDKVDLRPLRNKSAIYYLFDPSKTESVAAALGFYTYLKQLLGSEETFPRLFLVQPCKKEYFKPEKLKELATQLEIKMPELTDSKEFADSITFDDESLKCEEEKFIFEPLFRRRSISMIYSEPNVGKTFFAQSLALAMVHGANLFDMRSPTWKAVKNKPLRVLYIDSEMSKGSFLKRLRMLKDFYSRQYKGTDVPMLKYKLVAKSDWNLAGENPKHRDMVSKMLNLGTTEQIDFVIFDNLSTLTGGSDSQKNWMTFFAWLRQLSNAGVASCCLHHSGKNGDQRGTSLRSATLDNVIRLRRALEEDNSISLTVTVEKARDVSKADLQPLHIKLVKSKHKGGSEDKQECWRWVTMLANGKESLDVKERNLKIKTLYDLKLLSNKAIADFFGMEESTLKALLAKYKKGNADLQ